MEFDLKNVSAKKHKETKQACISFKSIIFVKNIFCLYFSPIVKLWPRKKVIFKVFIFSRFSKTLSCRSDKKKACFFIKRNRIASNLTATQVVGHKNDVCKFWKGLCFQNFPDWGGGAKRLPHQFFPCNFYKRRN